MDRPSVHVVIVNWNAGKQLAECLASFATVGDGIAVRVTVVDNASTDGSADDFAAPAGVSIAVLRNDANRGFAAACNQGAAGSDSEFLLFLNPDTRLMPGSLAGPAVYLREHESVGIVGIALVDENDRVARNTARAPSAWSMVGNSIGLDRLVPSVFPPHFDSAWAHDETRVVGQVMGAFFFVRRDIFEALGGFDERFFVYFEDVDFAVRARARGWSSVYLASARAFHRGQGTTASATARRTLYFCRSRILYARKHFGAAGAAAVTVATLALEPLARLLARPTSAASTLRAFAALWGELPAILRGPTATLS
jgi:N-acetylglucosaminyl-diphospho-decaprenol L-rhamnosyltransferase